MASTHPLSKILVSSILRSNNQSHTLVLDATSSLSPGVS
jgi:hypothetical protein